MKLEYATLERLIVLLFKLSETQRAALLGRFKYLQHLGGVGASAGPGRARYDLTDILRVVVTFELIDAGCSPARAVRIVRTHWSGIRVDLAAAWSTVKKLKQGQNVERLLWTVVPHVLQELGAGEAMVDVPVTDRAGELAPDAVLRWTPDKALTGDRHAVFIDLARLLAAIEQAFEAIDPTMLWSLSRALDEYARREGEGDTSRNSKADSDPSGPKAK